MVEETEPLLPSLNAVANTSSYSHYPPLTVDVGRPIPLYGYQTTAVAGVSELPQVVDDVTFNCAPNTIETIPSQSTIGDIYQATAGINLVKPIVLLIKSPGDPTSKDDMDPSDSSLGAAGNALYKACAARCPKFFQDSAGETKLSFEVLRSQRPILDVAKDRQFRVEVMREIKDSIERLLSVAVHSCPVLFAFLPEHENAFLSEMRRLCDIELGIRSVFLKRSSIQKALARPSPSDSSHFTMAAHKLSMRLGGTDHDVDSDTLRVFKGAMLVGMDIRKSTGYPSIVSVVASCEDSFAYYPASLRIQPSEDEEGNPENVSSTRHALTYQSNVLAD